MTIAAAADFMGEEAIVGASGRGVVGRFSSGAMI
jgi:hypothetical protein